MWDLRRNLDPQCLPENPIVVAFWFRDLRGKRSRYWLKVERPDVELCLTDPGIAAALTVETTLRTMVDVWTGHLDVRDVIAAGQITLGGSPELTRSFPSWLLLNAFAKVERVEPTAAIAAAS